MVDTRLSEVGHRLAGGRHRLVEAEFRGRGVQRVRRRVGHAEEPDPFTVDLVDDPRFDPLVTVERGAGLVADVDRHPGGGRVCHQFAGRLDPEVEVVVAERLDTCPRRTVERERLPSLRHQRQHPG